MQNIHYEAITKYAASCKNRVDVMPDEELYSIASCCFSSQQEIHQIAAPIKNIIFTNPRSVTRKQTNFWDKNRHKIKKTNFFGWFFVLTLAAPTGLGFAERNK